MRPPQFAFGEGWDLVGLSVRAIGDANVITMCLKLRDIVIDDIHIDHDRRCPKVPRDFVFQGVDAH